MTKKIRFLLFGCVFMMICCIFFPCSANALGGTSYTVDTAFDYPILPGSEEWASFDSLEEKIEACAVDEALLNSMTTPALLETVVNYPLLANIYAFDSIESGIASVSQYFKGIEILFEREDASAYIQSALQTATYSNDDDSIFRQGILESLSRYMSTPTSQNSARISTPGGSTLVAYYNSTWEDHEYTEAQAQVNHNRLAAMYPNATVVSGINPKYNCHSYAWYSTSTSNSWWIEDPTPYLTDGSYNRKSGAAVGYKAAWPGVSPFLSIPSHSAIVYTMGGSIKYISKWGFNGVFIHSASDCPYSGTITYWHTS